MEPKIYIHMLEVAFPFETALNVTIKSIFFHFNRAAITNRLAKPYMIVFNTLDGEKYRLSLKDIVETIHHIPMYSLTKFPATEYALININDQVVGIAPNDSKLPTLKSYEAQSNEYEDNHGTNAIDVEIVEQAIDVLADNGIDFNENDDALSIYDSSASYHILIPKAYKTLKTTGYCITPEPHEFVSAPSVGKFTFFNNSEVSQPTEYHFGIIRECPKCQKNIICDWQSFEGTTCPYCGNVVIN